MKLYPDGSWIFDAFTEPEVRDGKSYYLAHLTVRMSRFGAFEMLERLARQLRYDRADVQMDWSGTLERQEDDNDG